MQTPAPKDRGLFFVTPKMLDALDDRRRTTATLVFSAYAEEAALRGARNPFTPQLEPYRRLFAESDSQRGQRGMPERPHARPICRRPSRFANADGPLRNARPFVPRRAARNNRLARSTVLPQACGAGRVTTR
jgi:hypothetical protein